MKKKEAILIVLCGILVTIVSASLVMWNKPHVKVENRQGVPLTAKQLKEAYSRDEVAANAHYLNKALVVSGNVSGIDQNQDGGSMVLLDTGDPDNIIQCTMREHDAAVMKGTQVKVKGFCTGNNIMGITLTDCIVAKN